MRFVCVVVGVVLSASCSKDDPDGCRTGFIACPCLPHNQCNPGLDCISGVCVRLPGDPLAGDGSGGDSMGGDDVGGDGNGDGLGGDPLTGDGSGGDGPGGDPLPGDGPGGDGVGGDAAGDGDVPYCTSGAQCRSGICEGGECVEASACADHGECPAGQYCHFPTVPTPAEGTCEGPCTNDISCGIIGQECHSYLDYRRCYTTLDCNPGNNSTDCPPGEVCWSDSRTCRWPPDTCYFAEQCPLTAGGVRWVCDPATGKCIDPTANGECDEDDDCSDRPGCSPGCTCRDHVCEVTGSCDSTPTGDAGCGTGNYCAGNVCQPATPCNSSAGDGGHGACLPYSLVCRDNYCGNPAPCGQPGSSCTVGWCNLSYNPPVCFPDGAAECMRNEQCASDAYCSIPDGDCQTGCRNHGDCTGMCNGPSNPCYCHDDHICDASYRLGPGDPCDVTQQCSAGMLCAHDDPSLFLTCLVNPGDPACDDQTCRFYCDLAASQVLDVCPPGEQCGGDGLAAAIESGYGQNFTNPNASICYPEN